ncbi:Werner Syndrome-like exonuclease [Impatiens glandulifera]|uniref:Werner Syndrome-like exonuclease n=1 Tax=Impatiens glandulifera TaxID=253017 RepID=UPI001FB0EFAB|nr:Werner Syndrome-like exonuclease [Impatiens glandulifera]
MYSSMANPTPSITFNSITSKYTVNFAGAAIETTVTDKATTIDEWVHEILNLHGAHPMVVGLDIEWRPHHNSWMSNKSATLQLCIDKKCLIVQLFYVDYIPTSLKNFLLNKNFTFVGLEVEDDVKKLKDEYDLGCGSSADIKALAKIRWPGRFRRPGLKDLALEVADLRMLKPRHVTMSNWENRVLTEGQIEYGCIDAYASYKIGHILLIQK